VLYNTVMKALTFAAITITTTAAGVCQVPPGEILFTDRKWCASALLQQLGSSGSLFGEKRRYVILDGHRPTGHTATRISHFMKSLMEKNIDFFRPVKLSDSNNNNNNFIYIAPLKTMFTKCSTESQSKTSGIAINQYYILKLFYIAVHFQLQPWLR